MAREDKGSAAGSNQDIASGKSGEQDAGSLAARRARLRGSLSKQIAPPDPYVPSPFESSKTESAADHKSSENSSENSPENIREASVGDIGARDAVDGLEDTLPLENAGAAIDLPLTDNFPVPEAPHQSLSESVTESVSESINEPAEDAVDLVNDEVSPMAFSSSSALSADMFSEPEPKPDNKKDKSDKSGKKEKKDSEEAAAAPVTVQVDNSQVLELLNSLDQQIGICSVNLSQIAKAANEQLELVRNLSETVQHQAFGEIGLSLNSLSESMSAALEPMKAVGELVPSIDTLVSTIASKDEGKKEEPALTPEQLVTSLADQLSKNLIDPWTFKCAYMAVFPSEQAADLLRKLVDLLGTQKLTGELFRAAYDAVQSAEAPPFSASSSVGSASGPSPNVVTEIQYVPDETVIAQLDDLRRANDELKARMDQRELEFSELLQSKEQEVVETQEMLNSRWEDFSNRYEQLSEMMRDRNEELIKKESELAKIQAEKDLEMAKVQSEIAIKDSEITQLKSQLEEMRDQTKDMVADLQRQLTSTKQAMEEAARLAAPKPQTSFFDAPAQPANNLFSAEPSREQLFTPAENSTNVNMPAPNPIPAQNISQPNPAAIVAPNSLSNPVPNPMPNSVPNSVPQPGAGMGAVSAPNSLAVGANAVASSGLGSVAQTLAPTPDPVVPSTTPGVSSQAIPRPQVAAPTTPLPNASGRHGSGVRAQVFEVIVRQALAGAPWREICAGPMQVNGISPDEVESEVKRRQALLKK
ncbi:MAG: hypothetical protein J0M35_04020 [Candidatus Obscuribacter phosphatis]|uniref:Uncharacterized protein n=1 Tax=Candidatus Obscuribacter phosphatis TaxID=1906157 RepID=A0A8J7P6U3_9BACT|nr:hypothetical protein [Candidatus Obscuribacter phosphatis]